MAVDALVGVGGEVEKCLADSVDRWCRAESRLDNTEDAFALELIGVEASVQLFPAGRAVVTTTVLSRKQWNDHSYYYRLARQGVGEWVLKYAP